MLYAQKYMIYFIANNFVNLPTVPSCIVNPNNPKIDCGWLGIDQQTCEKRTCCWAQADPGTPWCYVKEFGGEYGPGEYRWFSLDVIAAMLVYRTIEKKSFGNLTLLLCKIRAIICYCFVHQHGRLITWLQTIYCVQTATSHMYAQETQQSVGVYFLDYCTQHNLVCLPFTNAYQ